MTEFTDRVKQQQREKNSFSGGLTLSLGLQVFFTPGILIINSPGKPEKHRRDLKCFPHSAQTLQVVTSSPLRLAHIYHRVTLNLTDEDEMKCVKCGDSDLVLNAFSLIGLISVIHHVLLLGFSFGLCCF